MTKRPDDDGLTPDEELAFEFIRGYEHARTLPPGKREAVTAWIASHDPQVGDVHVWTPDPDGPSYGHTVVADAKTARHYRRQTWIARLKSMFGRDPK